MRVWFAVLLGWFFIFPPAAAETVQPAVPIDRPAPDYPLLPDDLEGYVKLHFTIGKDGHVKDITPIESSPPGVFDAAAIAGMAQWSYKPRTVDGAPVDQPDNTILLRFKPSLDQPAALLNPTPVYYPKEAFDKKLEGKVTVRYDINEIGMTENVAVEGSAPSIFDETAVRKVQNQVFRPRRVDGAPQKVIGLTTVIEFKLSEARLLPKPIKTTMPKVPENVIFKGIKGFCVVYFTLEPDGTVSNPVVVLSIPHGVFDNATLESIRSWKFESPGPNAVPMSDLINFESHKREEHFP